MHLDLIVISLLLWINIVSIWPRIRSHLITWVHTLTVRRSSRIKVFPSQTKCLALPQTYRRIWSFYPLILNIIKRALSRGWSNSMRKHFRNLQFLSKSHGGSSLAESGRNLQFKAILIIAFICGKTFGSTKAMEGWRVSESWRRFIPLGKRFCHRNMIIVEGGLIRITLLKLLTAFVDYLWWLFSQFSPV